MAETERRRISVTVDADTAEWLHTEARRTGLSLGDLVDRAVLAVRSADGGPAMQRALAQKTDSTRIREFARAHPNVSGVEIARQLGCSQQLVSWALKSEKPQSTESTAAVLVENKAWLAEARRRMQPPQQPRAWEVELDLPEGADPLVTIPDPKSLAAAVAPAGWVAVDARVFSGRGCTMAPRWKGWRIALEYRPDKASGRRDWYLTDSAVNDYVAARRWADTDDSLDRAEVALERLMPNATLRGSDREGRELYRSPRSDGGLRWVVDPRPRPPDKRPRVIWVGMGAPPARVWAKHES